MEMKNFFFNFLKLRQNVLAAWEELISMKIKYSLETNFFKKKLSEFIWKYCD